jgi:hypothetical protein
MMKRHAYKLVVGKPLRRPRCRWVDNSKMNLGEDGVVCAGLMWLRIRTGAVNMVMNLRIP